MILRRAALDLASPRQLDSGHRALAVKDRKLFALAHAMLTPLAAETPPLFVLIDLVPLRLRAIR